MPVTRTLQYKQVLSESEYQEAREQYGNAFRVGMGAEAIQELLQAIDLEKDSAELKAELAGRNRSEARAHHQETGSCRSIPRVRQQAGVDDPRRSSRLFRQICARWYSWMADVLQHLT